MPNLNPATEFEDLKTQVAQAIRDQFPISGKKHRLELESLEFKDSSGKPSDPLHVYNMRAQYEAKTSGGTWAVPVKGRLKLVDVATGKTVDTTTMTLARLPKLTPRYSYIVDGQERQHDSVFRLRSAPYHMIADNGEPVAKWNVAKGLNFDLVIDRETGFIRMKLKSSKLPIYSILRALGVPEHQMQQALGREVFETNKMKARPADVENFLRLVSRTPEKFKAPAPEEQSAALREYFEKTELRPDATKVVFGKEYSSINGEVLLKSAQNLLELSKGQREPDDRHALSMKDITSTSDFVVESIQKNWDFKRRVMDSIDRKSTVREIVPPNAFWKPIRGTFTAAQRPEQHNPLSSLSSYLRTTLRGSEFGGVGGDNVNLTRDKLINPTHLGFLDPIQTPESADAGIALHLPVGVKKKGKDLFIKVYDVKKKDFVEVTPADLERETVAYPDQVKWKGRTCTPVAKIVTVYDKERRTSRRPWADVRYVLPSARSLFSFSSNLIPFLQNNQGNRAQFASKQQEQAVALTEREAPLVQVKSDGNFTFEQLVGIMNSHRSDVNGVVARVTEDSIIIKGDDGKVNEVMLYKHYPLNGKKTMLHSIPLVKAGDKVKKGQLIADTNYTKNGALALGKNLRVAYMPYHGLNFEDGIVVSESAAKALSSTHLHEESLSVGAGMIVDRDRWSDYAIPERATPERVQKLDPNGVIKKGAKVKKGDVLIAALSPARPTREDKIMESIHRSLARAYRDSAVIWDHDYVGTVVNVVQTRKNISVFVETTEALTVGDKLSGRHGNKGIISRIIPDHKMPKTKGGEAMQILLSPAGVPSRLNVGQVLETAASKIAKKTGQPYTVSNFEPGTDYAETVQKELKAHGLSDTETLFDPETGKEIGQILTGHQYMMKLHHQVDKKLTARSWGTSYTAHGAAGSGAGVPGGGQKLDQLMTYAMLAHGAKANLREMYTYKGDEDQDDVWTAVMTGQPLPPPVPPRAMKNFITYARGMGVDVDKKGDHYVLSPMTDKQSRKISNGEIRFPEKALYAKGLRTIEESGGLFSPEVTGGIEGKYWGHIKLQKRMPNPMFEKAIQVILDISKDEFERLVGPTKGSSGFDTITEKLKAVDVDKELKKEEARIGQLSGSDLAKSYKRVRYLRALKELNITPLDAYTNEVIPVVPPSVRRVSIDFRGDQKFDDLNGLYLSIGQINGQIKGSDKSTPQSEMNKYYADLYDAVRALKMNGMDMMDGSKRRHHQGLMERMSGDKPKHSFFQSKVISRRQDLSGRSTIVPEPKLRLDEVGLPLPMALEMFKPFVIKELHQTRGLTPLQARKLVDDKDQSAIDVLHQVITERPVLLKRDPILHKFNVLGFRPKITQGKAVQLHPLVCAGFNADFDGDSMAVYVPVSEEAVDEAKKMMPSRNIFSPTTGSIMLLPDQDGIMGLYHATKWGKVVNKTMTADQAIQMMKAGKLKPSDVITVEGKKTTAGRLELAKAMPKGAKERETVLYDKAFRLDKGGLRTLATAIGRQYPAEFATMIDAWKDAGNRIAYLEGSSTSVKDFNDGKALRDRVLAPYLREEQRILSSRIPQAKKDEKIVALFTAAQKDLEVKGKASYANSDNKMYDWVASGSRGKWAQFAQLVFTPMLVSDVSGNAVPVPIKKSWGEGLPIAEYWASLHGARKGAVDRSQSTRDPGAMAKNLVNSSIGQNITAEDCGSTKGVSLDPAHPDVVERYLAADVPLRDGSVVRAGELLTPPIVSRIRNSKVSRIVVRSPLGCKQAVGVCAKCYGLNEEGKLHTVGTAIGVIAAQALSEPMTQMTMRTFHSGGTVGSGGIESGFNRVSQILKVPKTLPNSAVLAEASGKIDKIVRRTDLGGQDVFIDGKRHYVPKERSLLTTARIGQVVKRGQALTDGFVNPHALLKQTKNFQAVRSHLSTELDTVYGSDVRRRNSEMLVKSMTNMTRVDRPSPESSYLRGQLVPLSQLEAENRENRRSQLPETGHTPQLKPIQEVPTLGEDWMAKLNFQRLKDTFMEGGAQMWSSDIHGQNPLAGMAHGAELGKPPGVKS
jgi:DNA-directed RNA polymerase subunit beta'